ncbi:MAG: EAL domain-containing protein [Campylobacterota bacterium]|nr:EAL domain-containing protein [Campylobacterota bacterium]
MNEEAVEKLLKVSKTIKVLYVEDNEEARKSTLSMLGNLFNDIVVAVDGLEGLEKFKKSEFDLIISDINMPKMNGIEMINEIRKLNRDISILILSAYNESGYFIDTIRIGIDGYLLKPIEFEQFVEVIRKSIEKIELRRENSDYKANLESKVDEKTKALEHLYYHDALTGLENRNALLQSSERYRANGLMLIDIDRFSTINSIYGEQIGDSVLINVAKILLDTAASECSVHRISGDQFAFLNIKGHDLDFCIQKANKIIKNISSSAINANIDEFSIKVNLSVTISIVHDNNKNTFLECADMALHHAKKTHQPLLVYSDDLGLKKKYIDDLKAVEMVKEALVKDKIVPFFQPIIKKDFTTYECLVRIIEDEKTTSPFFFIDAIKKTPYYHELTKTMIKKSIETFKDRDESFSINLSYEDISNIKIVEFIKEQLATTEISKQLIFEILETDSIENFSIVRNFIIDMKELGVRIAIDDFGSGYANFSHLIELKPDYIKIDGSLIKNIDKDVNAFILVKAITTFSKEMGIEVIAEYIHNEDVYKKVKELDICGYQGYYFSEPMPESEL